MDRFTPISLDDRDWIKECLEAGKNLCADFSFEGNYMWKKAANQCVAEICGMYVVRIFYEGRYMFSSPVGGGDRLGALNELKNICKKEGIPLQLCSVIREHIDEYNALGITGYKKIDMTGANDYVYEAEKLATLSGKKLHAKRNHINQFELSHKWESRPITRENIGDAIKVYRKWLEDSASMEDSKRYEGAALRCAFEEFEEIGLDGLIIYVDGEPRAFSFGSMINSDTADIHFEKADKNIRGLYPLINREFVRYMMAQHPTLKYINREDDMGLEGLRKSKLSYYPLYMVEKSTLEFI